MKLCKKCIYSKPVRQLGIVDWYCTFKGDWIGLPIDAMFCRNYITGTKEMERIVAEVIKEYYKKEMIK